MIIYLSQAELLVGKDWRKVGGFFVCFVTVNIQDGCIIQSTQLSGMPGPCLLPHPWHRAQQCPTESTGKQQTKSVSLQKMFVSSLHDCLDRLKTNSSWGVRASGETAPECWGHLLGLLLNVIARGYSKGLLLKSSKRSVSFPSVAFLCCRRVVWTVIQQEVRVSQGARQEGEPPRTHRRTARRHLCFPGRGREMSARVCAVLAHRQGV